MPEVAVLGATVECIHKGPIVVVAGQSVLTVGGRRVLLAKDVEQKTPGCGNTAAPCSTTGPADVGVATRLKVGSEPVLLKGTAGAAPPGRWSVPEPGQSKLVAK